MATQYAFGKIVTDGLVLCLDAADRNSYVSGSTTWYDLSGNGAHGTLINGTAYTASNGGALVFDGVDDGVDGINVPQNYVDLMIGMYSEGSSLGVEMVFAKYNDFDKSFRTVNGVFRQTSVIDSNDWQYNSTQYNYISGRYPTTDVDLKNNWNIVRVVNQNSTFAAPFVYSLSSDFLNRRYKGRIAFVLCYNRVLTPQEVEQNYNARKSRFGL